MDAGEVYRLHARAVRGYLRGQGVPDADDVLSEVFLHVARSLPRYRGEEADLRRWVFAIARNRVIDDHRRRSRRPRLVVGRTPDTEATSPEDPIDPALVAALGRLTADQREVVVLRFVADLPLEEVAVLTRRSEGAVKSMQHRALSQLARILADPADAEHGDEPAPR